MATAAPIPPEEKASGTIRFRHGKPVTLAGIALIVLLPKPFSVAGAAIGQQSPALAQLLPVAGVATALVITWVLVRLQGTSWRDYGLSRPKSWVRTIALAFAATVVCLFLTTGINVLMIMLSGTFPDVSRFDFLRGNAGALATGLVSVWLIAAFPEEMIYRGYILAALAYVFGGTRKAWLLSAAVSSLVFGLLHFYQGPAGIVVTGSAGLIFALIYLVVRRNLWVTIIAHGLMDSLAFVLIYLGAA